ncbi:hypothetical protein A2U01_0103514, partial [Trifolium medium]|nr:hypothetical protein [Trifolium medium]
MRRREGFFHRRWRFRRRMKRMRVELDVIKMNFAVSIVGEGGTGFSEPWSNRSDWRR